MSVPRVLDIDLLLAPFEGEAPGGSNPREDTSANSLYYRIKDQRNAARATERNAVEAGQSVPEEWQEVAELATKLIANQAKDLESAAWLTEAGLRLDGFVALRDGFALIQGLVENFWDHLYPRPDEDGLEARLAPIAGFNGAGSSGTLEQPIRMTPLVTTSAGAYTLWHYEQALDLERMTDDNRRKARIDAGAITLEQFNEAVREVSPRDMMALLQVVEESLLALRSLSDSLDSVAGADSPSFSKLRELLDLIASSIRHFGSEKLAAASALAEVEATADVAADTGAAEGGAGPRVDGFANREEALAGLVRIASFFRKTEPHSPLSYTIEEAVRRARMPLPELLMELTQDASHAEHILLAAGIKNAAAQSSE